MNYAAFALSMTVMLFLVFLVGLSMLFENYTWSVETHGIYRPGGLYEDLSHRFIWWPRVTWTYAGDRAWIYFGYWRLILIKR